MTSAHGGFGSEKIPLGGGAAVFERLCHTWARRSDLELVAVGAGPHAPDGIDYRLTARPPKTPSELSTLGYARFCRDFEEATTRLALAERPDVVLAHDISEGPNVATLRQAEIPIATIFHVDVVDIFSRLYLASALSAPRLTRFYSQTARLPWPQLLRLVFEKQRQVVEQGQLNVVPSPGAADLLERSYPRAGSATKVVGWGAPALGFCEAETTATARALRERHGIPQDHRVVLTLSRLSPEKAQHRLLQAVALAEAENRVPPNLTVVIAGAPAFMQGSSHAYRLRRLAQKLRTRVVFPGHVGGIDKAAWYRTADLFVVSSLHESYGLTTLEAMQQGCPVVAVSSFGTQATVSPQAGRLIPPGPELIRRLWGEIELLLAPQGEPVRQQLRAGALRSAQQQTFEKAAESLREALKQLP